ncbi:MAG: LytTR family transcriptional regulator [Clostridia bacterium]|nr:LytTR family transcriptional regulator [Clostridia bacterium]
MKIKLNITDGDYEKIEGELHQHGIKTDDSADLVLSKVNGFAEKLIVKDKQTNERVIVDCNSIVYIESFGHQIIVHTVDNEYYANERLYKLSEQLDKKDFIRVSVSVIVAKSKIKKITPTLSMKFVLTLTENSVVDVTRSYYHAFKEAFNI